MIQVGDALKVLRKMQDESVQCCVTSPPYWGLRDYGTAKWKGGDPACSHSITRRGHCQQEKQSTSAGTSRDSPSGLNVCRQCGAKRIDQQLGLESTPEEYVARMVEIFREVKRVLKNDGTLWLNLGDCYATGGGKVGNCPGGGKQGERWSGRGMTKQPKWANALGPICQPNRMPLAGLKPKDLVGIPWRVAFALQADGWYLRSDIIWHKPNPMPESVTDRCTKSHEYLFLLTKSERYYYDADAIKTPGSMQRSGNTQHKYVNGQQMHATKTGFLKMRAKVYPMVNRRTVWSITTKPFKGAHFATFPPKLIEPCILAGSRTGDIVLDPFSGAGTTGLVSQQYDRQFIGIELNPAYAKMARARIAAAQPALRKAA